MRGHLLLAAGGALAFASAGLAEPGALERLRTALAGRGAAHQDAVVEAFLRRAGPLPWIDGATLVFVARAEAGVAPRVVGDFNLWGAARPDGTYGDLQAGGGMERLGHSSWFALTAAAEPRSRLEYLFAYGERLALDPRNPRRVPSVGGEVSEVRLPGVLDPPELGDVAGVRAGSVREERRRDGRGIARRVAVYRPAGYDPARGPYPLVVFHDGALLLEKGPLARVLDRLIAAGRVAPLVGVFVEPADRAADYALDPAWRAWFVEELLADVARREAVAADPARRGVVGVSRGAVGAIDLLRDPAARLGFAGLLLPASEPVPVEAMLRGAALRPAARVVGVLARYDRWRENGERLLGALRARGAAVEVVEVPEGHGLETWRRSIGLVLERFAPGLRSAPSLRGRARARLPGPVAGRDPASGVAGRREARCARQ